MKKVPNKSLLKERTKGSLYVRIICGIAANDV